MADTPVFTAYGVGRPSASGVRNAGQSGDAQSTFSLALAAAQYGNAVGAGVLQALRSTGEALVGDNGVQSSSLPQLVVTGRSGAHAAARLPLVTVTSSSSTVYMAQGQATLPRLEGAAHATSWINGAAVQVLPRLLSAARAGTHAAATLPALGAAGTGNQMGQATAALRLPRLVGAGAAHVGLVGQGAAVLPALFSRVEVAFAVHVLPTLVSVARGSHVGDTGAGSAWVVNLETGALVEYTRYAFREIVRHDDAYYALGTDGVVYALGGDLDGTEPIIWGLETGMTDVSSPSQKQHGPVYLDALLDADVRLGVRTDEGVWFDYHYEPQPESRHRPHRILVGRGLRSRNYSYRLASDCGAYIELTQLLPEYGISKRNI